jgi:hypothetical protein
MQVLQCSCPTPTDGSIAVAYTISFKGSLAAPACMSIGQIVPNLPRCADLMEYVTMHL